MLGFECWENVFPGSVGLEYEEVLSGSAGMRGVEGVGSVH